MHDAVHLVKPFAGARRDVHACSLMIIKTRDVGLVQVDLGHIAVHPLRDGAGNARTFLDPARGDGPESLHFGGLAEEWVSVGCHGDESVDGIAHTHALITEAARA